MTEESDIICTVRHRADGQVSLFIANEGQYQSLDKDTIDGFIKAYQDTSTSPITVTKQFANEADTSSSLVLFNFRVKLEKERLVYSMNILENNAQARLGINKLRILEKHRVSVTTRVAPSPLPESPGTVKLVVLGGRTIPQVNL